MKCVEVTFNHDYMKRTCYIKIDPDMFLDDVVEDLGSISIGNDLPIELRNINMEDILLPKDVNFFELEIVGKLAINDSNNIILKYLLQQQHEIITVYTEKVVDMCGSYDTIFDIVGSFTNILDAKDYIQNSFNISVIKKDCTMRSLDKDDDIFKVQMCLDDNLDQRIFVKQSLLIIFP